MALPSGFFGSISRINTLGEGLRATNDVIEAAGKLRGFLRPKIVDRTQFENRFQAALEYQQEIRKLVEQGWPLDGLIEWNPQPVTALWIELDSAEQTRNYVSNNISLYQELATSASIVLPEILPTTAGIIGKTLSKLFSSGLTVIIIVAIVIFVGFALKKKALI